MANIPLYVESSLKHRLDPIRFHLKAGLSMLNTRDVDVATWDGIYQILGCLDVVGFGCSELGGSLSGIGTSRICPRIRNYTTPFLQNFFGDTKCCYGVAVNMGFDKADVAPYGGWQGFLDAHPGNWGDDRMVSDVVSLNSFIARPLDPVRYLPSISKSEGANFGPARMAWLDITWKTVHWNDLQPFQFSFTPIIMWDITKPNCLKTHGPFAVFRVEGILKEYEQFLAGNPPWNPGRRVGAWLIGFKLWFLSEHLASMNLKGGFIYMVEKATGIFVASSDTSVQSLAADENGHLTVMLKPQDVPHPMINGSATLVAPDGDWTNITHQLVEVEVNGRYEFMLTFQFSYYNLVLEGVYMVPRSVVLADLDESLGGGLLCSPLKEMATRDAVTSIILNIFFSGILMGGVIFVGYQTFKRLREIAQEIIRFNRSKGDFCTSRCKTASRVPASSRMLKFLDTEGLLAKFKKSGGQIVFFSYEWQSWTKLGPNDVQLEWMRMSLSMYSQDWLQVLWSYTGSYR
eukprot:s4631_g2.t1